MTDIYTNVKELTKKKNMKIGYVEECAGLARGTICRWNNHAPTIDNLQAVAKVLGVKVDKLIQ